MQGVGLRLMFTTRSPIRRSAFLHLTLRFVAGFVLQVAISMRMASKILLSQRALAVDPMLKFIAALTILKFATSLHTLLSSPVVFLSLVAM